jgi:hypothetical protein
MPSFYADVEVEVDEFVDNCSKREIEELVKYLHKEGHLNEDKIPTEDMNLLDQEWAEVLDKLSGRNRLQLSNEEEEIIKKIANRF